MPASRSRIWESWAAIIFVMILSSIHTCVVYSISIKLWSKLRLEESQAKQQLLLLSRQTDFMLLESLISAKILIGCQWWVVQAFYALELIPVRASIDDPCGNFNRQHEKIRHHIKLLPSIRSLSLLFLLWLTSRSSGRIIEDLCVNVPF